MPDRPQPPFPALTPPQRILLGPGPSEIAPSVLRAIGQPTLGHLDGELFGVQDEIRAMLRPLFGTRNDWTLATSGTGTSGMEACLVNLIEPGDAVLVDVHGYFGARLADMAERFGAKVTAVEGEWGRPADVEALRSAAMARRFKLLCVVHAETSTGVLQDLAPCSELAGELGALFVVDAVTSLGCVAVDADEHGVDAIYSCSQKGLSCPPGLAPVSFSPRAVEAIRARKHKRSFYVDAELLMGYWEGRGYHHTASSNLFYALHEALRLALAEGLPERFARHRTHGAALRHGLEALGLELVVPDGDALPQLTCVRIPDGVEDNAVRGRLLAEYGIEIGGGLGPLKGAIWRIGLMGAGSTPRNVLLILAALREALAAAGFRAGTGSDALAEEILALARDGRAHAEERVAARLEGLLHAEREACASLVESRGLGSGHAQDQLQEAARAIRERSS